MEKDGKLTTEPLYEKWFHCEDLDTQLVPVIKGYWTCCRLEFGCIVISWSMCPALTLATEPCKSLWNIICSELAVVCWAPRTRRYLNQVNVLSFIYRVIWFWSCSQWVRIILYCDQFQNIFAKDYNNTAWTAKLLLHGIHCQLTWSIPDQMTDRSHRNSGGGKAAMNLLLVYQKVETTFGQTCSAVVEWSVVNVSGSLTLSSTRRANLYQVWILFQIFFSCLLFWSVRKLPLVLPHPDVTSMVDWKVTVIFSSSSSSAHSLSCCFLGLVILPFAWCLCSLLFLSLLLDPCRLLCPSSPLSLCRPSPPQPDSLTWSFSCFAEGAVVVFLPPLRVGGSARVGWDFCMADCFYTLHACTWMRIYAVLFTIQTAVCWLQRLMQGCTGGGGGGECATDSSSWNVFRVMSDVTSPGRLFQ